MLDINNEIDDSAPSKQFNITLNAYEGPIDLLLELARKQKVDLSEIQVYNRTMKEIDLTAANLTNSIFQLIILKKK